MGILTPAGSDNPYARDASSCRAGALDNMCRCTLRSYRYALSLNHHPIFHTFYATRIADGRIPSVAAMNVVWRYARSQKLNQLSAALVRASLEAVSIYTTSFKSLPIALFVAESRKK
jgi:hypothetical protein